MMKIKPTKQQRGVVLLSCLIFLLLLLILLRFTMSSARMQEMKAGADFDNMNAQAAAHEVMRDAEYYILRTNALNGQSLVTTGSGDNSARALAYWQSSDSVIGKPGVYDGSAGTLSCTPAYSCIDWSSKTCGTDTICFGTDTGSVQKRADNNAGTSFSDASGGAVGKYIIERFVGTDSAVDLKGGVTKTAAPIYLRVTAVGFSKPGAVSNNTSNVIIQNTYLLTTEN